jgi:LmbE family N-acetylglucosaminyl deacetylase
MGVEFPDFARAVGLRRSLMIIAPHPDDETLGCGGLMSLARMHGISVRVVVVTDGAASHANSPSFPRERLVAQRKSELINALDVLDVDLDPHHLDLPDAHTEELNLERLCESRSRLVEWIERDAPDCIAVTWRREPHCDHRFAYNLTKDACEAVGFGPFLEYQIWAPLIGERSDAPRDGETRKIELNVASVRERKARATRMFESQLGLIRDDPQGFCLKASDLSRLITDTERYELSA